MHSFKLRPASIKKLIVKISPYWFQMVICFSNAFAVVIFFIALPIVSQPAI